MNQICRNSIDHNRELSGCETSHNQLNEMTGETKILHGFNNKVSLNCVIGFLEVQFHDTVRMRLPLPVHFDDILTHKNFMKNGSA